MNQLLHSSLLSQTPNIEHGFSTKKTSFDELRKLNVVFPEQNHGTDVFWINDSNAKQPLRADGLLTAIPGIAIGVRTADCVPILLYEQSAGIIAAIHAGWKGTLNRIAENAVKKIIDHGGAKEQIKAAFGPSIGMCCYDVEEERALRFIAAFGNDQHMVAEIEEKNHLNLAYTSLKQLLNSGVLREHVDFPLYCTSCDHKRFVSFRRDGSTDKEKEIVSFISME